MPTATYADFWLKIEARVERGYRVAVIQSPAGGGSETVALDVDAITGGSPSPLQGHVRSAVMRDISLDETPAREPRDLGRALFDALFTGTIRSLFDKSLGMAQAKGSGLRIKLQIDPENPELATLASLPWEMLYFHGTREYLSLSELTPVVRFLDVQRPYERAPFSGPLRVLVAMANPDGSAQLDLAKERAAIESTWATLPDVEVRIIEHTTRAALLQALADAPYHVLHFMGHGGFQDDTGEGVLLLETSTRTKDPMTGTALGVLLRDMPSMRLVFLNACDTARLSTAETRDPFAGVASALVMAGVPAVLAMQFPVSDAAAVAFSNGFYTSLVSQRPVDAAVGAGRKAVHDARPQSLEWATPVLFMRAPDGYLFTPVKQFLTTGRSWALTVGVLAVAALAAIGYVLSSSKPINLSPEDIRAQFPRTLQIVALSDGAPVVPDSWTSSDTTIAAVKDGRVSTRRAGTATITAKLGWFSKGFTQITVTLPAVVALQLAQRLASMSVGDTLRIPARALAADDFVVEDAGLVWTSTNEDVTRVTPNGAIFGLAAGRAFVLVTSRGGLRDSVQVAVLRQPPESTAALDDADSPSSVATDTVAPVLLRFALSRKSTYVRTTYADGTYYSATARFAVRNAREDDDDAWYAQCDGMLAEPSVQAAVLSYLMDPDIGSPVPRGGAAVMLARDGFAVKYKARLREQFLTAPGRTIASSQIDDARRNVFMDGSTPADRARITSLVAACTPPQAKDALVFSVTIKNPSATFMNITAVRYLVLDDRGEAGGGAGAAALEPVATYLHRIRRKCLFNGAPESFPFSLTPMVEVAPGRTAVIDLQPTIRNSEGSFLAPLAMRVEVVTDHGTVRSRKFWVEGPSCAG